MMFAMIENKQAKQTMANMDMGDGSTMPAGSM
jgi:hypothetical protein